MGDEERETGNGSLGTSGQRHTTREFRMADKEKEKGTIWGNVRKCTVVNVIFY